MRLELTEGDLDGESMRELCLPCARLSLLWD